MKFSSSKIKNINFKLKQIKIYKKKKNFLIVNYFKQNNKIINFNSLFFLVLIPKKFFFKIKPEFNLILKKMQQTTKINLLTFKKGFNNNILKFYFTKNLFNFLLNKNKVIILYNFFLQNKTFIFFLLNFYSYIIKNFYIFYSFYQKTILSIKSYNYLYNHYFQQINKNIFHMYSNNLITIFIKKQSYLCNFFFLQILKLIYSFFFFNIIISN
jgi:hypothetical protein